MKGVPSHRLDILFNIEFSWILLIVFQLVTGRGEKNYFCTFKLCPCKTRNQKKLVWIQRNSEIFGISGVCLYVIINPIPLLFLNRRVSAKLAPAFILLCKILTLKTKFARNYEKIKAK